MRARVCVCVHIYERLFTNLNYLKICSTCNYQVSLKQNLNSMLQAKQILVKMELMLTVSTELLIYSIPKLADFISKRETFK